MLVHLLRLANAAHKRHPIMIITTGIAASDIRGRTGPEENGIPHLTCSRVADAVRQASCYVTLMNSCGVQ